MLNTNGFIVSRLAHLMKYSSMIIKIYLLK